MERKERLNKLNLKFNGGPGSGNFNPGQGRGVGKPDSKTGKFVKSLSPSLKMSENSKKFYEKLNPKIQESFEKCIDRLKKTNISLDNVELEFVNSNTSGGDNGWVNVIDGDNIDSKMIVNLIKPVLKKFTKKEQDVYKHSFVADNSSEAIIDHEFGHIVMYKKAAEIGIKPKSANLFAEMIVKNEAKKLNIDLNDKSTENFSEYAHRNYTEFIAEAYSRPDYSKLTQNVSDSLLNNKYSKDDFKNFIMEFSGIQTNENNSRINRLVNLEKILNGGKGSGNFNPGQGRGVGKPANGSNKYKFTKDSTKEELSNIKMKLINEFLLKKEKILNGAKDPQAIKKGIVDKNSIPATKEQMDKIDKLSDELSKTIQDLESKYYKAKDNFTEPGFYKDSAGNIYEVVPEWGKEDYSYDEEYQKMFPVDAPRTKENTFFVYKNQKLEKASDLDVVKSIREGMTLKGISRQEERVIKSYTYATPQNTELRKGTDINEIPSAKILKDVIDRTKSEKGTFYRGFRTKEGAKELLNLKVGDIYQDKGFMSTDRTEEIAKDFSASKILLEIENNKTKFGTNLSVSSYSMHPEENEVLFNAGTKMKVKEILEKDGYTVYKVEVI